MSGGEETTYVSSPTYRPTDLHRPDPYYSYRVTLPHLHLETISKIVERYTPEWCCALHHGDSEHAHEHFHFIMFKFDQKLVDAFKKLMAKTFAQSGNGFHAGKFMTNDPVQALGYMKHDDRAEFHHSAHSYWSGYIEQSVRFEKGREFKPVKEKMSFPMLTYGNLLKQALKYRQEHNMDTDHLQNVLSRMVNQGSWQPSRELIRNGVPLELHQMFHDRVHKKERIYNWMSPHVPSEDKKRFLDVPYDGPIHDPGLIQSI